MRGLKSTVALIVVLAGLGAYIYYGVWKKPEAPGKERVFVSLKEEDVAELRLKSAGGEITTLKKNGNDWDVVEPVSTRADLPIVSGVAGALAGLEVARVVDEKPANLKDYGLDPPRFEVAFKTAKDKDFRTLSVGEKSPAGADLFAMRSGDPRVFLVQSYQESSLNHTTFELREKTLVKFDREKVDGLEITAGGKTIAIEKDGAEWKLVKPVQVKADYGAVEGIIGRLQSVQMKSIETSEASAADLKKFGLDKPTVTATLKLGSARATVTFGTDAGTNTNTTYVRDESKPTVMTVENSLREDLQRSADEYRRKDVFEFRAFNADRLEVARGGETTVFEKTKGSGDNPQDKWRRISPTAKDIDKDAMDGLLVKLANMRAASFVDTTAKTGLTAPALTVSVKFDDGKKEDRVTFGKNENDVYAARQGAPGAAKIDSTDYNEAVKALDEIAK